MVYKIQTMPEGENRWLPTPFWFRKRKSASTFVGIEGIAGMGESYRFIRSRKKKK